MKSLFGHLRKMKSTLSSPVEYQFVIGDTLLPLNAYLENKITLRFTGNIHCIQCGRKTSKSFQQGYCFPCMQRLNECGNCAIFPERCQVESGTCPQDDWAHAQCDAGQIVYLANASGLKVGITRDSHIPTRWIDQGAIQALPIFKASNRYRVGMMEVALKQYVSDRTNWRTMLKNETISLNMLMERDRLFEEAKASIQKAIEEAPADAITRLENPNVVEIHYPVIEYPKKITSLSLDKQPEISGILLGIKGQYLILDTGVMNIRKFGGYEVDLSIA